MMRNKIISNVFKRSYTNHVLEPSVLVKKNLNAASLILNRPKRLNALDMEMVDIMYPYLKTWEQSKKTNVVLLEGVGRGLCAGGDVKDVVNMVLDPKLHDKMNFQVDTEYEMFHFMGTMKTPYIAVMNGITMGAGGGLSFFAPFRVATETTQFAMPEAAIGLFCDVGASFFYSRLDGYLGRYLGLTSRVVKAEDALFSGIATHFVQSDQLEALKDRLAQLDEPNHDKVNEIIHEFSVKVDHVPKINTLQGQNRKIIDACFRFETVEEIVEALKGDGSEFALETLKTMMDRSPTSLKITLEHLVRGVHLTAKECLRMEHKLWQTVPYGHDFVEGVTSHVIKKQKPKWKPSKLEELDLEDDIIVPYFNANVRRKLLFASELDFMALPYAHFALPEEKVILEKRATLGSDEKTIDWFVQSTNNRFGIRQKVKDVLDRQS